MARAEDRKRALRPSRRTLLGIRKNSMETELSIQPHTNGRSKVTLRVELNQEETLQMEKKMSARHADSSSPVPCLFYQETDPSVKTIKGIAEFNKKSYKCYFLISARRVLLNRPILGKTHMRIPLNGTLELGYINPQDEKRLGEWWKKTKEEIKKSLVEALYNSKSKDSSFAALDPISIAKEATALNPIDPNEVKGLRKRALEDF